MKVSGLVSKVLSSDTTRTQRSRDIRLYLAPDPKHTCITVVVVCLGAFARYSPLWLSGYSTRSLFATMAAMMYRAHVYAVVLLTPGVGSRISSPAHTTGQDTHKSITATGTTVGCTWYHSFVARGARCRSGPRKRWVFILFILW